MTADMPPEVAAAEMAVVGACITSRPQTEAAAVILEPGDFADPNRQLVFEAAVSLAADGNPVDPAAVLARMGTTEPTRSKMARDDLLLMDLLEHGCQAPSLEYHARAVKRAAALRKILLLASQLQQQATAPGADPEGIADAARAALDGLLDSPLADMVPTAAELIGPVLEELDKPMADEPGIPTGLADLDEIIPGLRPGQVVIIGARPGVGKSTVSLGIARHASIRLGHTVPTLSLEMSHDEVMHRIVAAEARVSLEAIMRRNITDADWERVAKAQPRILDSQLFIDDASDASLARLRLRLRRLARTSPAQLVIVDYLGLLRTAGRPENRQQAVAELARGLKHIAREFEVPVVVCAQLNRASEQRHDKQPTMADLRESGEIEAAADIVLLLDREELRDPLKRPGEIDVLVVKQRQGRLGTVAFGFHGEYGRCVDLTRTWTPSTALEGR